MASKNIFDLDTIYISISNSDMIFILGRIYDFIFINSIHTMKTYVFDEFINLQLVQTDYELAKENFWSWHGPAPNLYQDERKIELDTDSVLPDIIIIDGGRGHLSVVNKILLEKNLTSINSFIISFLYNFIGY